MSDDEAGSVPDGDEPEQDESVDTQEAKDTDAETAEAEDAEGDEGENTEGDDEDGIEFDFGGDKVRFPKTAAVAEVADRLQEYAASVTKGANQKFQEAAEVRKAATEAREALDELSDLNTEALEAYAATASVRDRIKQLEGFNLQAMWQSNPDQARRVSDDLARLRTQYQAATANLDQIQDGLRAKRSEQTAKAMEAGKVKVAKLDPEFEKHAGDVVKYVSETYGIPEEQAAQWPASPEVAVMARKAMLWDRAQKAAKTKPRTKAAEATPVRTISGKGGNAKPGPSDKQSVDAWMRERKKQVAREAG